MEDDVPWWNCNQMFESIEIDLLNVPHVGLPSLWICSSCSLPHELMQFFSWDFFLKLEYKCLTQKHWSTPGKSSCIAGNRPLHVKIKSIKNQIMKKID